MNAKETKLQFVQKMIVKLRTFLLTSEPVLSMNVEGGAAVTYDREGAREMLKEYEKEEQNLLNPNRWMRVAFEKCSA